MGRQVLRSSGLLVRLALIRPRWARAVRNTVSRGPAGDTAVSERIAETISGIGVRYPAPRGASRDVGTRAPDVVLRDGRRLYEVLRGGRFVLLGSGTRGRRPAPAGGAGGAARSGVRPVDPGSSRRVRRLGRSPRRVPGLGGSLLRAVDQSRSQATGRPREGVVSGVSGAPRMRAVKLASSSTKAPDSAVRCRGAGAPT